MTNSLVQVPSTHKTPTPNPTSPASSVMHTASCTRHFGALDTKSSLSAQVCGSSSVHRGLTLALPACPPAPPGETTALSPAHGPLTPSTCRPAHAGCPLLSDISRSFLVPAQPKRPLGSDHLSLSPDRSAPCRIMEPRTEPEGWMPGWPVTPPGSTVVKVTPLASVSSGDTKERS